MVRMRWLLFVSLLVAVLVQDIICPPVKSPKVEKREDPEATPEEDVNFGLEYERYLKEVVSILETDEVFKKKLEDSNISDIKSGEIARHLELVSHNVRTKLDELKRQELDRLRQIQRVNMRRQNGLPLRDMTEVNRLVAHLDHNNPHTFEVEDLSKLIKQATDDLESLDKQRKDEFKRYEMEKEHLHKKKMATLDEIHRKEEEKAWNGQKEKHKEHPKLHHPGSRDQLEEVWEESDGLAKDDFDPRTFFMLHDTNGDGMLDPVEVEALFQKELDKIYDPNAPEDDMMERYEEMNRMREHVMKEVDKNKDSFITLDEFMESTKGDDYDKDQGWKTLDDQELFTEEELAQFEKEYEARRGQEYDGHVQPGEINMGGGQGGVHPAMMHRPEHYQQARDGKPFKQPRQAQRTPEQHQAFHHQQKLEKEHKRQHQQQKFQQEQHYQQPLKFQQPQQFQQPAQYQNNQQFQQESLQFQPQYQQQQRQQPVAAQPGGFVHPHAQMRQRMAQDPQQQQQQGFQQQPQQGFQQQQMTQQQQQVPQQPIQHGHAVQQEDDKVAQNTEQPIAAVKELPETKNVAAGNGGDFYEPQPNGGGNLEPQHQPKEQPHTATEKKK